MEEMTPHSINFYGEQVDLVITSCNETYIGLRRVCENLGLSWSTQRRKITKHHRFSQKILMATITTSCGGRQETLCLHRSKFFLWLYSINPDKVSPEIRAKLIKYQDEIEDAIERYFANGIAVRKGHLQREHVNKAVGNSLSLPNNIENIVNQLQLNLTDQQQVFQKIVASITHVFSKQKEFQQYALQGFDRIEAVLAESLPHNMFEGWEKTKSLVDDMTEIYGLSDTERKKYFYELCQSYQIQLPEKALFASESMFKDTQEIAIQMGLYSINNKPHLRLVRALLLYLGLDQDKYCQKFSANRRGYSTTIPKYSDNVIPHLEKWLRDNCYPETIELANVGTGKKRRFRVKYRFASPNSKE